MPVPRERPLELPNCVMKRNKAAQFGITNLNTKEGGIIAKKSVFQSYQNLKAAQGINQMEFGHVVNKVNRGLKTKRPLARIQPKGRKNKQQYGYAGLCKVDIVRSNMDVIELMREKGNQPNKLQMHEFLRMLNDDDQAPQAPQDQSQTKKNSRIS
ncbi:hypothetical protein Pcinc_037772 [Petrolisthes cinctipes]|uniref:Uncharacterized protein n=1 Tax=Petrolisthes cinctipes TaxID=88211 RepID=A0AAE1BVB7_PETCI|nr:hypothetical protein Pcinc_037772 [Petrolisthes cinctipes]